jgi:hypothetical protein
MDPLLVGILSGIVSGLVSSYLMINFIKRAFQENYEEYEESESDIIVNIEFQESSMFLYNKRTSEFIIQGSNWEAVIEELVRKYPGKNIMIENNQLEQAKRFGHGS